MATTDTPRHQHPKRTVCLRPDFDSELRKALEGFERADAEAVGEMIYAGRRNQLIRFVMAGREVVVKCFRRPHILNRFIYRFFRRGKAARSYDNALRLIASGFHTPEPIAYIEETTALQFGLSFYFSAWQPAQTMRDIETRPECDLVLRTAAAELARLHSLGIYMRDYSPGNVMYTLDDEGGCTLWYVDLNRIDFNVRDKKRLEKNFERIIWDEDALRRFARYYAEAADCDPAITIDKALRLHAAFRAAHNRKKRLKRLVRH